MNMQFKKLRKESQIANPDDFYQDLIDLHAGLSDDDSRKMNARLILILANHIGDMQVLKDALQCAANVKPIK